MTVQCPVHTMTTIQLRIDEKTKQRSKKILDELGLDMISAVKLFLRQIIIRRGIPFNARVENGWPANTKATRASAIDYRRHPLL